MTETPVALRDSIRQAMQRRCYARAAELCQIGLNRCSLDPNEPADASSILHRWREEAERFLRLGVATSSDPPADFHCGTEALGRCDYAAAIAHLQRAVAQQPDSAGCHAHLGMALLGAGYFADGWREYEWRTKLPWARPRVMQSDAWTGEAMPGQVLLLWDEQGLGDAIQFIRFAKEAAVASKAQVIFHGRPRLCRLFRSCPGLDEVIPRTHNFPPPAAHASIVSLPALLGLDSATGQSPWPYLSAEPGLVRSWEKALALLPRPRVGLAWQGSPGFCNDSQRSVALSEFLSVLTKFSGKVSFVSLQKGPARAQLSLLPTDLVPRDLGRELDEGDDAFVDTAAVMSHLDLVITTDTSLAHLAGALGATSWLLLGHGSEWRWGRDSESTPLYPRARLFRRGPGESWANVMDRVGQQVASFLSLARAV
jgi:hypothetical protein